MMYNSIGELILKNMALPPTASQRTAIECCAEYLESTNPYSLFLLKGYAGTGKTFLMQAITSAVEETGMRVELMASTGRAAKQLEMTTGRTATTIHRRIYRATSASIEEGGSYKLVPRQDEPTLFIVDEASMIGGESYEPTPFGSGNLLEDLLSYVWDSEGCKLIMVGDSAQLPPIGSPISDALNAEKLYQVYGMQVYESELREVVRQGETSGILSLATSLRNILIEYEGSAPEELIPISFSLPKQGDINILLGRDIIDTIDTCYRRYGRDECLAITPSNKRALAFSQSIRGMVLDYEEEIGRGERLIVARNNYHYTQRRDRSDFIANGELIEVRKLHREMELYDLRFADATVYLPDRNDELEVRLLLSGLADEQAQRTQMQRTALYQALYADYAHQRSIVDIRRSIRQDPFWGALEVKYGYAVTAHKAQGGQWSCIFVDLGMMSYLPNDLNMVRWLYTAITRATKRVYLVNPPETLIEDWSYDDY
ncbi:MAG: AAA family ATPase [Porphyromonadaceae bacterium]|nr:AAA family ATPase [Porphyromonadaceae bacterium]